MKQLFSLVAVMAIILTGCQKIDQSIQEPVLLSQQDNAKTDNCQLQSIAWDDGYSLLFTFNSRGLVHTWTEDYYGDLYVNTFEYNDQGKLISSRNVLPDGSAYTNLFYYERDKVVRQTAALEGTSDLVNDVYFTFNNRGQWILSDDVIQDIHSEFFYNARGDFIRNDFYVGETLVYKIEYEYLFENRNAFLALPGMESWWTSYNVPLFTHRWESTTKVTYYDGADEILLSDYDPASIEMETGHRNYITYLSFFDRATETPGEINFTYANCGPNSSMARSSTSIKKSGASNIKKRINRILSISNKNLKKEIIELRNELRKAK